MTSPLPPPSPDAVAARVKAAAERARAEADMRRAASPETPRPAEIGGSAGPDPVRHGDWNVKGRASDF